MNPLDTAVDNLTAPMVLAFALGAVAALAGSDLRFPRGLAKSLSIYLLLAIGLKGGMELNGHGLSAESWVVLGLALALLVVLVLCGVGLGAATGRTPARLSPAAVALRPWCGRRRSARDTSSQTPSPR